MTRIVLHIGLPHCGAERLQDVLNERRGALSKEGVLIPQSAGRRNQTRLFMAMTDPDHVDPLRWNRGHHTVEAQKALQERVRDKLLIEVEAAKPEVVILSAHQIGASLHRDSELERLRDLLHEVSSDIRVVAHVDEQARVLARHYAHQISDGRVSGLDVELALANEKDWRDAALADWEGIDPALNAMPEVQSPPFWLDYPALKSHWESIFGEGCFRFRPFLPDVFASDEVVREVREAFELPMISGKTPPQKQQEAPSHDMLTRARALNELFQVALNSGRSIPKRLRRSAFAQLAIEGDPIAPGSLHAISRHFAKANRDMMREQPELSTALAPDKRASDYDEPAHRNGFRATQYFTALLPEIDRATRRAAKDQPHLAETKPTISKQARRMMPKAAVESFDKLSRSRFAPHNGIGRVNEEDLAAPFDPIEPRQLKKNSTGRVIVACMKNEGPYIVEWVAYHRAIGVDNFLIYTNGCEDGTAEILDRLQEMGIVEHRNNDKWRGNSPQQFALNQAMKERVVRKSDWIIHIDVDEFINVRTGNGTLDDFLKLVPDATNVAMTWRLFGNNGINELSDEPVIAQFDSCAPKYCPKPHTVWGFKTMTRNIGAYDKLSCHRPNKLKEGKRDKVAWVNGSGQPMGDRIKEKGWRSEVKSVGYDLVQLNHYALRSAESFMIKRQRGRALHVDRSIGLNYWIRMDWSDHKDVTIQRNLPRLKIEMDRLLEDRELRRLHKSALKWHRAKAQELHGNPEFSELYEQALKTRLEPMERVAYALALDMES